MRQIKSMFTADSKCKSLRRFMTWFSVKRGVRQRCTRFCQPYTEIPFRAALSDPKEGTKINKERRKTCNMQTIWC